MRLWVWFLVAAALTSTAVVAGVVVFLYLLTKSMSPLG